MLSSATPMFLFLFVYRERHPIGSLKSLPEISNDLIHKYKFRYRKSVSFRLNSDHEFARRFVLTFKLAFKAISVNCLTYLSVTVTTFDIHLLSLS